jgi:hypothetical protein
MRAILSDWGSRMSGPLTVPLTILAFYVSNHAYKVLYASLALLCGFLTAFAVWLKERERYESEVASHSLRSEWQSLQGKFAEYPLELYAHWILRRTMPTKREWEISGARDGVEGEHFAVLVEEAGNFLLRTDWKARSHGSLNDPSPISRWLEFVCEVQGDLLQTTGSGHVKGVEFDSGHVADLARICSLVCAKLAAKETWPSPTAKVSLR